MADERDIAAYYDRGDEEGRLGDWGRLEFLRTRELLARFLPAPPATVLDVGGAAGAYALPLAAEGYEVHLVDPVALHVEQARAASAAQPDAPARLRRRRRRARAAGRRRERRRRPPARAALPPHRGGRPHPRPAARPAARCAPAACSPPRPSRASPRPSTASPRASCSSPASRRSSSATSPTASTATPTGIRAGSPPPTSIAPTSSSARSRPPASRSPRSWRSRAPSARRPRRTRSTPGSTTPAAARSSCAPSGAWRPSRACSASPHVIALATARSRPDVPASGPAAVRATRP